MTVPSTLSDIRLKIRRITARPSAAQITDEEIDNYINTFYIYDMPEHLKLESLRYNYQFTTQANVPVYDLPTDTYLTVMPPVFIAGYQSYMTQSRENFFRINPELNFLQQQVYTGDGTNGSGNTYTGQFLTAAAGGAILQGFKPNPPGAFSSSLTKDIAASNINWNIVVSAEGTPDSTSGITPSITLIDDGQGNLFAPTDTSTVPSARRGTVNYITGAITITNFTSAIPVGNPINVQYVPYVPSRPQSAVFFQDQIYLYPIPDQAYTVSFEAYKYPTALINSADSPQLKEWWQLLAYGAADKIFADNADFDNLSKFRPLLKEQLDLVQRRTIVQQTSERVSTVYTEQTAFPSYPFGNLFSGF